ncbi:MAG: hypothetical protein ACP5JB_04025 [candidate division WOR-3 bacterium]|jgi:outer membrane protein assembly factor BamB
MNQSGFSKRIISLSGGGLFIGLVALVLPVWAAVWSFVPNESVFTTIDKFEIKNIYLPAAGSIRLAPGSDSLAALEDAVIWSIAVDGRGNLYLGTGNQSTLYRLNIRNGKLQPVFTRGEGEIFAVLAMDNAVYFGTSPSGAIFRVLPNGETESLVNTGESYIHSLVPGPGNTLICATGPNGRLYRIYPDRRVELLFTAPAAHITTLHWLSPDRELLAGTAPGGTVYRLEFSPASALPRVSVFYDTPLGEVRGIVSSDRLVFLAVNPDSESDDSGSKPVVYALNRDGIIKWQWQCPESTVFGPVRFGGQLLVGTGSRGLIYSLDSLGNAAVFSWRNEPQVIAAAVHNRTVYFGTGNPARLYRFTGGYADSGYVSGPVFDCQVPARFGRLDFRARVPEGTEISFDSRSGNSEKPDTLWSSWQPVHGKIASAPARFVQWRARLYSRFSSLTPELERVDLYYQPVNRAPAINRLEVSTPLESEARRGNAQPKRQVSFDVQDPDSDSLIYQLYLLPEPGTNWLVLKEALTETRYELDTRTLPDGWYRLRLVATDQPDRGPAALRTEKITPPFLVDNTPPVIRELKVTGNRVRWIVVDSSSPVGACRIALNAGNWEPVEPEDGVLDENEERFDFQLELKPGINTIAVWAADAQGNTSTRQLTVSR